MTDAELLELDRIWRRWSAPASAYAKELLAEIDRLRNENEQLIKNPAPASSSTGAGNTTPDRP